MDELASQGGKRKVISRRVLQTQPPSCKELDGWKVLRSPFAYISVLCRGKMGGGGGGSHDNRAAS